MLRCGIFVSALNWTPWNGLKVSKHCNLWLRTCKVDGMNEYYEFKEDRRIYNVSHLFTDTLF